MKPKEAIDQLLQIAYEIERYTNPKFVPKEEHIFNDDTDVRLVIEAAGEPLRTCEIIRFKSAINPTEDKLTTTGRYTRDIFIEVREKKGS